MPATNQGFFRNSMWLGLIVLCLSFLYFFLPQMYKSGTKSVQAAGNTFTVCASGCDFTSISSAYLDAGVTADDTLHIGATYSTAGETFPLTAHPTKTSLTIDCQDSGATIGTSTPDTLVTFTLNEDFVVQNCLFTGVNLSGTSANNLTISNNGGSDNRITINKGSGHVITDNTGLEKVTLFGVASSEVSGNSVTVSDSGITDAVEIGPYSGDSTLATNITVASNTIVGNSAGTELRLINISEGSGFVVATNTLRFAAAPENTASYAVRVYDATSTSITGNTIDFSSNGGGRAAIAAVGSTSEVDVTIRHNTIKHLSDSPYIYFADAHSWSPEENNIGANDVTATVEYNIFYNASSTAAGDGLQIVKSGTISTASITNDYNGFYNLGDSITSGGFDSGSVSTSTGSHSQTANPYFKTADADNDNNFELAPFSSYLDVNGTRDIGAYSVVRGNSFLIDDNGTIDYSSIHATSTEVFSHARSSDTFVLSAGTYDPITVSSTNGGILNGLMISGAGASTIINAGANTDAVTLRSVQGTVFQNMTVQNASTTESTYALSRALYSYGGNDYDDSADLESDPNSMFYFQNGGGCDLASVADDATDMTDHVGDATAGWHLALASLDVGVTLYIGIWVPGDYASSAAEVETLCSENGIVVDAFISNVFAPSSGEFTYNSAAVSGAGITMMEGYTNPPTLDRTLTAYAGIKVAGTSFGNSIENITSTGNGYGMWFTDTANTNDVVSSVIEDSVLSDIYSNTTGTNSLKNVTHDITTNDIEGDGTVKGYYTVRWYVQDDAEEGISGAQVTYTSDNESVTGTETTGETGYTDYTDFFQVFTLTSSTPNSSTAGGYNPYTMSVASLDGYAASSTANTIDAWNQTFTITLDEAASAPTAPSSFATTTVGSTSAAFSWTDNSSGLSQETSFILDYIAGDDVSDFPGTTTTVDQDETSATVSDLSPNTQYTFRLAATNDTGTSSYVTSSAFYTNPAVPASVSASANGQTSMIVSWGANSNPSGTVYELYNNTTGAVVATTTATTYTVTGLTAGTSYQFKVRAEYLGASGTWTSYSSLSSAVSTASASSGGGGGGFSITPAAPAAPEQGVEFSINNQAFSTVSTDVVLTINSPSAALMAVSNSPTFDGVSYEPYTASKPWRLTAGAGVKTVYVKLRTAEGGEKIVKDTIELVGVPLPQEEQPVSCPLMPKFAYKSLLSSSVYYVTKDCTKRAFVSPTMFFSYFRGWNEVRLTNDTLLRTIPNDSLGFMPWGPNYDPKYGALVKVVSDPNVYLLLGEKRYWIKTESVFTALGYSWKWVEDISDELLAKYSVGEEITAVDRHPNYTVVKYAGSPQVYRLEPSTTNSNIQVKRHIVDERAFNTLGFRWDRIVVIANSEVYPDGPVLTGN